MASNDNAVNVAAPPPVAVNDGEAAAGPRPQSGWQMFQQMASRMLIMYLAMQAMNYFRARPPMTNQSESGGKVATGGTDGGGGLAGNMFPKGSKFVSDRSLACSLKKKEKKEVFIFFLN